jgi:hypothetical protein
MKTSTLTILLTRNTKSQQVYTIPNVSRPCVCWAPSPIDLGSNVRCINVNYTNFWHSRSLIFQISTNLKII